ncbi:MAG: TrbC/VirB2 family protein [Candidatus Micrarchaeia archaeon]
MKIKNEKNSKEKNKERMNFKKNKILTLVLLTFILNILVAVVSAANSNVREVIGKIHGYATVLAAIGFSIIIFYSGYKFYFAESELERKDAWTTLGYGIIGALLVIMAPKIGSYLMGDTSLFSSDPKCTI